MNVINEISNNNNPEFSSQCFWDTDTTFLDYKKDKSFIIARIVNNGTSNDELLMFNYYGWETVKEEVLKIKYLNNKILHYLSCLFGIDKRNFRSYGCEGLF